MMAGRQAHKQPDPLARLNPKPRREIRRRRSIVDEYRWLCVDFRWAGSHSPTTDAARMIRARHGVHRCTLQRWAQSARAVAPAVWLGAVAFRGKPVANLDGDLQADSLRRKAAVAEWEHARNGVELGEPGSKAGLAKSIAAKHGISVSTLHRWTKLARMRGPGALVDGRRLRWRGVTPPEV